MTALRIGAGKASGVTGTDLPVVRDSVGKPYIPGSSFKGALRANVESFVRAVPKGWACDPLCCIKDDEMKKWQEQRKMRGKDSITDKELADRVYEKSCDVCRVFGSKWLASKISIRDLLVDESIWFGQFEVRNGVAIDRDTGTAGDGLLYDFEVVPAGIRFDCEIVVENAEDWELGLLMAGLRPFERGEASLGGARSRGLGLVKLAWNKRTFVDRETLLDWLEDENAAKPLTDENIKFWIREFKAELTKRPASAAQVSIEAEQAH
jgi:CRISPR-associated RAMP protein (TIGR02581 family)